MVAIVIFSDDGTAYCMGKSKGSVIDCVTAVTNSGQMDLKYVSDHELDKQVVFYGRRPVEEMPAFYKLADACLVSLKSDNATGLTLPSKVQGYMAAGKPIIGMIDGSAKDVIDESGCGICVNAGDVNGLADGLKDFIEHRERYRECEKKARQYFIENFCKEKFMMKLESEIERVGK